MRMVCDFGEYSTILVYYPDIMIDNRIVWNKDKGRCINHNHLKSMHVTDR